MFCRGQQLSQAGWKVLVYEEPRRLSEAVDVYVSGCGRVLQSLPDVLALQVGVVRQDLIERPAGSDQPHHGLHRDT